MSKRENPYPPGAADRPPTSAGRVRSLVYTGQGASPVGAAASAEKLEKVAARG